MAAVVRALEERFPGALRRIVMLDRNAYLPERAYRFEPISTEVKEQPSSKGRQQKRNRQDSSLTLELAL